MELTLRATHIQMSRAENLEGGTRGRNRRPIYQEEGEIMTSTVLLRKKPVQPDTPIPGTRCQTQPLVRPPVASSS
jgi:hypothetical protein